MPMGEILNGTRLFDSAYFCQGQMKLSISVGSRIASQSFAFCTIKMHYCIIFVSIFDTEDYE